ncbi:CPBP family intramembrane glutamic endopeptidase [Thermoproteus tenax]|uniref:Predicted metal-dependent membrane protease n=1 Tax=Thermoproteus tenax (strain ATCC 35583 / DSM 2078 / JCM 9277 / NBRC 100435 / Kra 1) TaxID=768679 RepID=G4RPS4_THETK|nr:CPBP family intramembrane glutamic endopeptidase [Thermoproteus tenax]CCC81569.1 Predicted metal-dependent membrane protease [Thermoproteus tenax Kra 1]
MKNEFIVLIFILSLFLILIENNIVGYSIALALTSITFRNLKWVDRGIGYLLSALAIYALAFAIDFYVGPKEYLHIDIPVVDVLAPVVEEVIFRGLPFLVLPRWAALIFSTAVFALLHPFPLLAFLYAIALTLAYLGGGLASSIVLHTANNVIWTLIYLHLL